MLKNVKKEKNAFTRIVQDKISASLFYRKIKKDVWVSWEYRMKYRGEG